MNSTSTLANPARRFDLSPTSRSAGTRYELRFVALFNPGRGLAFPCDAGGRVDIDSLGERARANYFYARGVIGREFFAPVTLAVPERGDS
jgi:hypothetical protein